jgi:hypothetical protein
MIVLKQFLKDSSYKKKKKKKYEGELGVGLSGRAFA